MFIFLLVLLLIFPSHAHAEIINLTLVGNYFDNESNLEVKVETDSNQAGLKVRPRISPPQTLFIYAGGKIFSLGSFWSDIPAIPNQLTLHAPISFQTADLWFEVLDTQTGKVYETAKKQVFSHAFVQSYINDLNSRIFGQ